MGTTTHITEVYDLPSDKAMTFEQQFAGKTVTAEFDYYPPEPQR